MSFSRVSGSMFTPAVGIRWVSMVLVGAIAVALMQLDVPAASAASSPAVARAAVAAPKVPLVAADVRSAQLTARVRGQRVEALSERTEASTTWVNPNGSLTTDSFGGPMRVRDAKAKDGWADVDLTLVPDADGSVSSRVHPQGLHLAGRPVRVGLRPWRR